MILADFMTDLSILLIVIGGVIGLAFYVLLAGIVLIARHAHQRYRKQGGAPALAKQIVVKTSAGLLKRVIFGRFK